MAKCKRCKSEFKRIGNANYCNKCKKMKRGKGSNSNNSDIHKCSTCVNNHPRILDPVYLKRHLKKYGKTEQTKCVKAWYGKGVEGWKAKKVTFSKSTMPSVEFGYLVLECPLYEKEPKGV